MKKEYFLLIRQSVFVSIPTGFLVGLSIAGYDAIVNTLLWDKITGSFSPTVLCFFPILGLTLSGTILSFCRVPNSSMADEVVFAYHHPAQGLHLKSSIPKFLASIATLGLGCSAGLEGSSKWVGAVIATSFQKWMNRTPFLKPIWEEIRLTMIVGASAGIAAVFRAPLSGTIMALESPYKKDLAHEALIPALVAAAISYSTFITFRSASPYFPVSFNYHLNIKDLLFCPLVGLLCGLSSNLFLFILERCKKAFNHSPQILRSFGGGIALCCIALFMLWLTETPATLQSGLSITQSFFSQTQSAPFLVVFFVLKLLATAITFGFGGVGGLFVPSASIGAALGALCDLGLHPTQPGLFTLIGIASFIGASYNSLLFAVVFVAETSGNEMLVTPALISCCFAFLITGGLSNSKSQITKRISL